MRRCVYDSALAHFYVSLADLNELRRYFQTNAMTQMEGSEHVIAITAITDMMFTARARRIPPALPSQNSPNSYASITSFVIIGSDRRSRGYATPIPKQNDTIVITAMVGAFHKRRTWSSHDSTAHRLECILMDGEGGSGELHRLNVLSLTGKSRDCSPLRFHA